MAKQTAKKEWYIALKRCWHSAEHRWVEPGGLMDWSHLSPEKKAMHLAKHTGRPATAEEVAALLGDQADTPPEAPAAPAAPADN